MENPEDSGHCRARSKTIDSFPYLLVLFYLNLEPQDHKNIVSSSLLMCRNRTSLEQYEELGHFRLPAETMNQCRDSLPCSDLIDTRHLSPQMILTLPVSRASPGARLLGSDLMVPPLPVPPSPSLFRFLILNSNLASNLSMYFIGTMLRNPAKGGWSCRSSV